MLSVYRQTEIENLLKSANVTGYELAEFVNDGSFDLDISKIAIDAIPELDQDFMDQFMEAHPEKFGLPGIIENFDIVDILQAISDSGEYDEVIEHVVSETIKDSEIPFEFEEVSIERTTKGWILRKDGCSVEINFQKKRYIKRFDQNIWKNVCGLYASWDILGCSTNESIYPQGVRRTVYIKNTYIEELFS